MKLGAESDPMLPLNVAIDLRKADHDCGSAAGASAREVGISEVLVLLDINANGLDITHLQVIDWIVWWIEDSDGRSKLPLDR
jgi:hypothetical protein